MARADLPSRPLHDQSLKRAERGKDVREVRTPFQRADLTTPQTASAVSASWELDRWSGC